MANSKKKTYEAKAVLLHNGEKYAAGRLVELTDLQAQRLLDLDVVAETEQPSVVEVKAQEAEAVEEEQVEEKRKSKKDK